MAKPVRVSALGEIPQGVRHFLSIILLSKRAALRVAARRSQLCRQASALAAIHRAVQPPGSARLAVALFAHTGLLPVARFGAKEDGVRGDA